jgi:hypothetical protein
MRRTRAGPAALALLFSLAAPASGADTCRVKAVLSGKSVTMTYCAAAVFEDAHSVTLYFSDAPFTAKEIEAFRISSYATDRTEEGRPRTMMHLAFCPGGGKPEADPAAAKSVEMSVNDDASVLASRQWVFELPKERETLRFERLAGRIVPGGRISGRAAGGKTSDGLKYAWDATFDLALPEKAAAAGPGCGN